MIQGIQLEITGKELVEHLEARAGHHLDRMAFYRRKVGEVGDEAPEVEDEPAYSGHANPVEALKGKVRQHRKQAALFQFMAEHIVVDETYRITEQDLMRLEWIDA